MSEIFFAIWITAILEVIILGSYFFLIGVYNVNLFLILTLIIAGLISLEKIALKYLFNHLYKEGVYFRNILVVGSGKRSQDFLKLIHKNTEWRIKVVGLVDEEEMVGSEIENTKVIGSFNDIEKILEEMVVDEVIFILPRKWLNSLEEYIKICENVGVKVSIAVDLFSSSISKPRIVEIYGAPFLSMDTTPHNVWHLFIKRVIDFVAALVLLIFSIPIFIICAIAIKLTSPGPIIFSQKRLGLNGRTFTLYKFRTMIVGADKMLSEVRSLSETSGPVFHSRNDPRVTSIGRFLRMTSLDELPQLINVLLGDMSLIGPRPPLPEEAEEYERWQRRRLSLRPGIVCTWQVTKRFEPDFQEWVQMDLDYIDNWSLGRDFKILFKVLPAILKGWRYWRSKKG